MQRWQRHGWLVVFFALTVSTGRAQSFRGMVVAGATGAQVNGDDLGGYNKGGLVGGVGVRLPLAHGWSVDGALLFAQKGSRTSSAQLEKGLPYFLLRLHYLDVPLLAHYQVRPGLAVEAGPVVGVLLSARFDNGNVFVNRTQDFRPVDVAGAVALDYTVFDNLSLNMRLSYSVLPMNRVALVNTRADARNQVLTFTARYLLRSGNDQPR